MDASDPAFAESSSRLLRAWARGRSDAAFRQLAARYLDMVHSVAVRRLGEHRDAATDVTQAVFVLLARKADALPGNVALGAWLHRQTVRQCLNLLRSENRRRLRETEATAAVTATMNSEADPLSWSRLAPVLDEAIAALEGRDRDILHLRYFENQRASDIAATLGISAEAAQKRMERALENLRSRLRRSLAVPAGAAVGALMAGHTVRAAPAALAEKITDAALARFRDAGILSRLADALSDWPLTALTGAAAGAALGLSAVSTSSPVQASAAAPQALVQGSSTRSIPDGASRAARPGPPESMLAALERIGRSPANFRAEVAFDALMTTRPGAAAIGETSEQAAAGLSPQGIGQAMSLLLKRWRLQDPQAVMEFLAAHRYATWAEDRFWSVYSEWIASHPDAASQWLLTAISSNRTLGEGNDRLSSLAMLTVRSLTRDHPEAGVELFPAPASGSEARFFGRAGG
ncbi:MAG: sigma-70 family RNA polymerase sigma factor [Verrucomicrobiota bacterium]